MITSRGTASRVPHCPHVGVSVHAPSDVRPHPQLELTPRPSRSANASAKEPSIDPLERTFPMMRRRISCSPAFSTRDQERIETAMRLA